MNGVQLVQGSSVSSSQGVPAGTSVEATVTCPATAVILGGGGSIRIMDIEGELDPGRAFIDRTYPLSITSWRVRAVTAVGLDPGTWLELTPSAMCSNNGVTP